VTERQYSAEEHEQLTKQNNESWWIKFKQRNTVHCSEKELSKCDQETRNNEVISNGHNKRPSVQTSKGTYKKTQFDLEAQSLLNALRGLIYGVLIGKEEESHGDVHEQV
jgi:hypothetical protein